MQVLMKCMRCGREKDIDCPPDTAGRPLNRYYCADCARRGIPGAQMAIAAQADTQKVCEECGVPLSDTEVGMNQGSRYCDVCDATISIQREFANFCITNPKLAAQLSEQIAQEEGQEFRDMLLNGIAENPTPYSDFQYPMKLVIHRGEHNPIRRHFAPAWQDWALEHIEDIRTLAHTRTPMATIAKEIDIPYLHLVKFMRDHDIQLRPYSKVCKVCRQPFTTHIATTKRCPDCIKD